MNALHEDITNKVVVLQEAMFKPQYRWLPRRLFVVTGGFGAKPDTWGRKIFGKYLMDTVEQPLDECEEYWTYGFYVERLATEADLQALEHARLAAQHGASSAPEEESHV